MYYLMTEMRLIRVVLDRFCKNHGLQIGSLQAIDAARHCMATAAMREYSETELLAEIESWYVVSRPSQQAAKVRGAIGSTSAAMTRKYGVRST